MKNDRVKKALTVDDEMNARHAKLSEITLRKRHEELLKRYDELSTKLESAFHLKEKPRELVIEKTTGRGKSESTAFIVASDWHVEEEVKPAIVSGLNHFNLAICDERVKWFWKNAAKLVEMHEKEANVNRIVLCLLGDFYSGSIHDELVELNQLAPGEAIWRVQNYLISGMNYLLAHTKCPITVVCKSGNHGRMTDRVHVSTEAGNSLEFYMYRQLALHFEREKRFRFVIEDGYHTFLKVYKWVMRIHHGHHLRYQGGIGGLYIPVNKAIAQWNKARRADWDLFGHWHTRRDGGNFIANGSLIGYNGYAVSIKADFEEPQQTFFLINSSIGKSEVAPIALREV